MELQEETRESAEERELLDLDQRILQAEEEGDEQGLEPLLAGDFYIIRRNGERVDRQPFLKAVRVNAGRGRQGHEAEAHVYGGTGVVLTRVSTNAPANAADGTKRPEFMNTRVFVRQAGEWCCVAWQVTEIMPTP